MDQILVNKAFKNYNYISRYETIPYYFHTLDQKYVYGTAYQMKKDINFLQHTVETNETFDSISLTYYNTPLYYWVIMDYNNIQDPFIDLKKGDVLLIPTLSAIAFEVTK